ncbi:hypothetical protein BASA81_005147 [Batrachochytrium salamandrivorans]|nr:hypothetical protein BASA81_005147 [Batrachochytrium salamandrivorans]
MQQQRSQDLVDGRLVFGALALLMQSAPLSLGVFWLFPELAENDLILFTVMILLLVLVGGIMAITFQLLKVRMDALSFGLTFAAFTAYMDLFLASAIGLEHFPLGKFYLQSAEKYFGCAYGFSTVLWDGTFQFPVQFALAYWSLMQQGYHYLGLIWAGSIINSMFPLLVGAFVGPYSPEIGLATWLNAPYVVFPVSVIVYLMQRRRTESSHVAVNNRSPVDFLVILFHLVMPVVHLIRVLVVLGSQHWLANWWTTQVEPIWRPGHALDLDDRQDLAFLSVQTVQSAWWFIPIHMFVAYELVRRTRKNVRRAGGVEADLSALLAGAYLQSTACVVGTSVLDMNPHGQFGIPVRVGCG